MMVAGVEQLARLAAGEHRGEGPDGGQGHQRHQQQRHDLPADRLPAKAHGLPQLDPHRQGVRMCVNKRREPTTDAQITRRAVRKLNVRIGAGHEELSVHCGRLPPGIRHFDWPEPIGASEGSWPEFFAFGNLRGAVVSSYSWELGAESATGAACRT